jgi:hypothetical protein
MQLDTDVRSPHPCIRACTWKIGASPSLDIVVTGTITIVTIAVGHFLLPLNLLPVLLTHHRCRCAFAVLSLCYSFQFVCWSLPSNSSPFQVQASLQRSENVVVSSDHISFLKFRYELQNLFASIKILRVRRRQISRGRWWRRWRRKGRLNCSENPYTKHGVWCLCFFILTMDFMLISCAKGKRAMFSTRVFLAYGGIALISCSELTVS